MLGSSLHSCQCEQRNIGAGEPEPTGAAAGMRSSKIKRIVAPFAYEGRKSHRKRLGAASVRIPTM
jgi:hypothetical protein